MISLIALIAVEILEEIVTESRKYITKLSPSYLLQPQNTTSKYNFKNQLQ